MTQAVILMSDETRGTPCIFIYMYVLYNYGPWKNRSLCIHNFLCLMYTCLLNNSFECQNSMKHEVRCKLFLNNYIGILLQHEESEDRQLYRDVKVWFGVIRSKRYFGSSRTICLAVSLKTIIVIMMYHITWNHWFRNVKIPAVTSSWILWHTHSAFMFRTQLYITIISSDSVSYDDFHLWMNITKCPQKMSESSDGTDKPRV